MFCSFVPLFKLSEELLMVASIVERGIDSGPLLQEPVKALLFDTIESPFDVNDASTLA